MNVETIERDGQLFAVIPMKSYESLIEHAEMLEDIAAFDAAKARNETALPAEVWKAIARSRGEGIAAIRNHRGMTQKELCVKAGITQPYLSAIEANKKAGSAHALQGIAKALHVLLDDMIGQ